MVKFSMAFLLGVCLFQAMPQVPPLSMLSILLFIAVVVFVWLPLKFVSFLLSGFIWSWGFALYVLSDQVSESLATSITAVTGTIIDVPYQDGNQFSKFLFATTAYKTKADEWQSLKMTIQLYRYNDITPLKTGEQWQFAVKLKPPVSYANPGSFDREKWLFMNRIQATGSIKTSSENKRLRESTAVSMDALRQHVANLIDNESGYQYPALLKALSIGVKDSISQVSWEFLQKTGTAHLVAISGLHIGLVSGMCALFLGFVWRSTALSSVIPVMKIAAIGGIVVSIIYAALAGFAIPTVRAMIMIIGLYLSLLLNRHIKPLDIMATALFLIILINPMSVLSNGFWLSFLAVAWILYFLSNRSTQKSKFKIAVKLQFVLAMGLLPIMLTDFQQISIIGPIANSIAVPFASVFIVPSIMLSMLSLPVSETLFLKMLYLSDYLIMLLYKGIHFMGSLFISSYPVSLSKYLLVILVPGLLLLMSPFRHITAMAGIFLLGALPFWKPALPDEGELWMTVLDVGQGLSVVLQTKHHVLVYDAGPVFASGYDMGKSVVVPFLRQAGIRQINTLMISHSDNDHSGGARSVFEAVRTQKVLAGEPNELSWAKSHQCQENTVWNWDSVRFKVISPSLPTPGNNGSCVLQVTDASGHRILIPGDIEWPVEHKLALAYQDELRSDIMIAPHHGSKTSSRLAFLNKVNPSVVIVPAGYKNRYHFPHPLNVEKYISLGAKIYTTGIDAAIFVRSGKAGQRYRIDTYRHTNKHYWQTALK